MTGKFVKGKWVDMNQTLVPSKYQQKIKVVQNLFPSQSYIEVNGQTLKCNGIEIHTGQQSKSYGYITITIPLRDFEFESDSSVLNIEWNGMKFKRVE